MPLESVVPKTLLFPDNLLEFFLFSVGATTLFAGVFVFEILEAVTLRAAESILYLELEATAEMVVRWKKFGQRFGTVRSTQKIVKALALLILDRQQWCFALRGRLTIKVIGFSQGFVPNFPKVACELSII
jgi:hypothetical protein